MVLVSSNVGFTELLRVLPGGIMLWKIKCPSNQEEAGTVSVPFSPLLFERLKKRALCFHFKESYTEIHLCGIHRLHLCHSWAAVGFTGRCWRIPNLDVQSSVLARGSRSFFYFLSSLKKFFKNYY